ncbi:MAG: hypothetical protein HYZ34_00215 [Ignavibacteriae bacterium]|nr:hypothetical protein [Ignavibacteriota bacterium]
MNPPQLVLDYSIKLSFFLASRNMNEEQPGKYGSYLMTSYHPATDKQNTFYLYLFYENGIDNIPDTQDDEVKLIYGVCYEDLTNPEFHVKLGGRELLCKPHEMEIVKSGKSLTLQWKGNKTIQLNSQIVNKVPYRDDHRLDFSKKTIIGGYVTNPDLVDQLNQIPGYFCGYIADVKIFERTNLLHHWPLNDGESITKTGGVYVKSLDVRDLVGTRHGKLGSGAVTEFNHPTWVVPKECKK